jgi:hypothetical protein
MRPRYIGITIIETRSGSAAPERLKKIFRRKDDLLATLKSG